MFDELLLGAASAALGYIAVSPLGQLLDTRQLASARPSLLRGLKTDMPRIAPIPLAKPFEVRPPLAGGYRGSFF